MTNNIDDWGESLFYDGTGNGRAKRKKDRYGNPLGVPDEMPGSIGDTEEIMRRSREADNAIGEAARKADKRMTSVKISDEASGKPVFRTDVPSVRNDTGTRNRSGNLFGYGTETVDTRLTEDEQKERDDHDSLSLTGANEGFTIREDTSELAAESKRRIEENAAFIERFMKGNEAQQRFANGIPAPGEAHQNILGMYMGAKSKRDNAMQGEWGKTVQDLNGSSFGQGVMDVYHSGAAGGYDVGNGILRGTQMVEPFVKKHYQFPWKTNPRYTDPETGIEYEFDPMEYGLYRFRQQFRDESKNHEEARSEDFDQASVANPGYLGMKAAGKGAQDIMALLGTGWIIRNLGPAGIAGEMALGALNGKGKQYDEHMDEVMKKSEEAMWKNGVYREMRKAGRTDHEARFAIGTKHARMGSDAAALFGAFKAMLVAGAGRLVRDGSERWGTRTVQDLFLQEGSDSAVEGAINFMTGKNNGKKN